jgi:hypothetical protein
MWLGDFVDAYLQLVKHAWRSIVPGIEGIRVDKVDSPATTKPARAWLLFPSKVFLKKSLQAR